MTFREFIKPKTLYVKRAVLNAREIRLWALNSGFATTLPPDDLHVTIAFSRTPFDWSAIPPDEREVIVPPASDRIVTLLGDGGAIVLKFNSDVLTKEWRSYRDAGASWDFPEYQPHMTISYSKMPSDLSPWTGEIRLGPQKFAEVDENWKDAVKEI